LLKRDNKKNKKKNKDQDEKKMKIWDLIITLQKVQRHKWKIKKNEPNQKVKQIKRQLLKFRGLGVKIKKKRQDMKTKKELIVSNWRFVLEYALIKHEGAISRIRMSP
jgi:hypothetical protein